MVFFTCNKCGDSLKKKDCANHAGRCYPLALTCVDCHKDFFGNDFVAHTSCVTEAEKYGVKGFVSRAPSTAGATKQDEWTRAIHSATKISDLTPGQRRFLGILAHHGNVPRKKKPFQNFARNVWRDSVRQLDLLDQVFGIVESEFQKIKAPPKGNSSSQAKVEGTEGIKGVLVNNSAELVVDGTTNKESEGEIEEAIDESIVKAVGRSVITEDVVCKDTSKSSKKRKKKHKEEVIDGIKELKENEIKSIKDEASNDTTCKKSKKKKHKKCSALEAEQEVINNGSGTLEEPVNASAEDDSISAKSKTKKKKKRNKSAEAEEEAIINGNGTLEEPVNASAEDDSSSAKSKTKKKKKHKKSAEAEEVVKNGIDALEAPVTAEDDVASVKRKRKSKEKFIDNGSIDIIDLPKKSKKSKHKRHEENAVETVENGNGLDETSAKEAAKKSKKKKLKLQDGEECVPKKKSKTTSG